MSSPFPKTVKDTISWLRDTLNRPPLPECPIEAATVGKEPKQPNYISGWKDGEPIVRPINWKQFQTVMPQDFMLGVWFRDRKTGIGTLGGWNGQHWLGWIDLDSKDFASQEACDRAVAEWVEQYPILKKCPRFRTPNGGYRFLIAWEKEPENFGANNGFSLSPDGTTRAGELLTKNGGHTLLPPTSGVNGKPYCWEYWQPYPPIAESPESVGVYPLVIEVGKPKYEQSEKKQSGEKAAPKGQTHLIQFLKQEVYPRLTPEQLYDWHGHNWRKPRNRKLKGFCPWHESGSGTAFYVVEKDGVWLWRCPACNCGGDPIGYRDRMNGGNGSPKGKEFVEIVEKLAREAGVSLSEKLNPQLALQVDDTLQELRGLSFLQESCCATVLPQVLMEPLSQLSKRLNVPVESYVASLLAVASSQIASETRLELDPATNFYVPPVFWLGIVGETGSKKSPILRAVTSPLDGLQQAVEEEYQARLEEYESEMEAWEAQEKGKRGPKPKMPSPKELYLSDFTLEALSGVLGTQPDRGMLTLIDELARFFSSMDAYRNGKGGDRQAWLSLYDGGSFKVNRKGSGRVYASKTSVSLLGGIQPAIIQKIMNEDASQEDGLWSRFAWVRVPLSVSQGIQGGRSDLSPLLKGLYQDLSKLPAVTYRLESEAVFLWNKWHLELEQLILKESSPILRSTYPKSRERAGRLALVIYLIDAVITGIKPADAIPAATLEKAIEFTRWLMGQTRLMYAEFGIVDNPEAAKILKFVNRFRDCGWITAKQVTHWHSSKDKPTAEKAREFMKRVVELGYGRDNGKQGSGYQIEVTSKSGNFGNYTLQKFSEKNFEAVTTPGNSVIPPVTPQPQSLEPVLFQSQLEELPVKLSDSYHPSETHQNPIQSQSQLLKDLPGYQSSYYSGNQLKPSLGNSSSPLVTELPKNSSNQRGNILQVGDRVRYIGNRHLGRVCWDRVLTILAITLDGMAEVRHEEWRVTQRCRLEDLRPAGGGI